MKSVKSLKKILITSIKKSIALWPKVTRKVAKSLAESIGVTKFNTKPLLLQESIGDPVLPNLATELVAVGTGAVHVGVPIHPFVGLEQVDEASGINGITQYRVKSDDQLEVHGFADRNTRAGEAARQQIQTFLETSWAGAPRIEVPPICLEDHADGSCDFYDDPAP